MLSTVAVAMALPTMNFAVPSGRQAMPGFTASRNSPDGRV